MGRRPLGLRNVDCGLRIEEQETVTAGLRRQAPETKAICTDGPCRWGAYHAKQSQFAGSRWQAGGNCADDFGKQSQFAAGQKDCKCCYGKGLWQRRGFGACDKQSQFVLPDAWRARHTLRSGGECAAQNKANSREWPPCPARACRAKQSQFALAGSQCARKGIQENALRRHYKRNLPRQTKPISTWRARFRELREAVQ